MIYLVLEYASGGEIFGDYLYFVSVLIFFFRFQFAVLLANASF